MALSVTTRHSSHGVKPPIMSRVAAAGRGFGPVLPPGSGAHGDFGISTEPMMYTVAFEVWTLPQTTGAPLTV